MKKKILLIFILALVSLVFCSCGNEETEGTDGSTGKQTLYVYNWGEYIADGSDGTMDVNAEFEKYCKEELGLDVTVNYSTYSSNEDMYAKLSSGAVSYDIVVPSDYMVARLAAEGLLREINPEETIENYKYIDSNFKNLYYDAENKYSVPYTFGTVGIIYNTELVDENDPDLGSWNLMWSEKYSGNILQFNNPRDGFATAQFLLGYSINSTDKTQWENALLKLKEQKDVVQGYVMDEIFNKMQGGSAAIAAYYAGDFFTMYENNDRLAFFYPEEGENVFVDAMCIPSSCKNYELALEYINFVLREDVAVEIAEYICYASPNVLVRENEDYVEYMSEIHPDAMEILYGFDDSKMEYFYDLDDETRNTMNSLWEELKIESTIGTDIIVICAVIVALLLALLFWRIGVKQSRAYWFRKITSDNK